ncbi:MAG: hypothetical protein QXO37_09330 [Candidatus Nitrosocaldaceae archaeon]
MTTPNISVCTAKFGAILVTTIPNKPTTIRGIEKSDFVLISTPAPITANISASMSLKDENK